MKPKPYNHKLGGMFGKKHTKETKEKLRKAREKQTPPMKGRKHSKKTKNKISESGKGKNNSNWKGGISHLPYSIDWTETLKRSIRERDHYICRLCSQRGNAVHHIDYDKMNCNPKNLITLCDSCHGRTNFNRKKWINYFKEIINEKI